MKICWDKSFKEIGIVKSNKNKVPLIVIANAYI